MSKPTRADDEKLLLALRMRDARYSYERIAGQLGDRPGTWRARIARVREDERRAS